MAIQKFGLDNLHKLGNGAVAAAMVTHLNRLIADCEDRPALDKARTLTLTIEMVPRIFAEGANPTLDTVDVGFTIAPKVPPSKSHTHNMQPRRVNTSGKVERMLVFNDMSEDDVQQMTIDGAGPNDEPQE